MTDVAGPLPYRVLVCDQDDIAPDECVTCGGSATLGGTQEAVVDDGLRFCSGECVTDYRRAEAEAASRRAADWCSECGYDNHEHAPGCVMEGAT